jgi:curved DNA-binding protein CbpA
MIENHYATLGVAANAGEAEIKKAFRAKAKELHPDIAGSKAENEAKMRKLLAAYQLLMSPQRRQHFDSIFRRFNDAHVFDYRTFLRDEEGSPESYAKLIFYELIQFEDDDAINDWRRSGGLDFEMQKYLDREDWMDCAFMLAEELAKRDFFYEAFILAASALLEERKNPYFRHFAVEVETFTSELVRLRLKNAVENPVWIECLKLMLTLEFGAAKNAQYKKWLVKALKQEGRESEASEYGEKKAAR